MGNNLTLLFHPLPNGHKNKWGDRNNRYVAIGCQNVRELKEKSRNKCPFRCDSVSKIGNEKWEYPKVVIVVWKEEKGCIEIYEIHGKFFIGEG